MIKKKSIIVLCLFTSCFSKAQETITREPVTESMVIEQEKLCKDKNEIQKIENEIESFLDTVSIEHLKKQVNDNLTYYLNNRGTILEALNNNQKEIDKRINSELKLYLPNEEKYIDKENIHLKLVNNNHIQYRDTIQKGTYFNQLFEYNKSFIKPQVMNSGFATYNFENEETTLPYYSLNSHSEQDLRIMNIYYHDGTEKNVPVPIEPHSFPLNSIPVEKMKHVDSLQMEFKIRYLTKIDSIHFEKNEIGVQKGAFKLLKMEDNYVEYETPNAYDPYLEAYYYTNEGRALKTRFSISNLSVETPEQEYNEMLNYIKITSEYINGVNTKEQAFLTLKYLDLKNHNGSLKNAKKDRVTLEGNVNSFTLYVENRSDTITFLTTLKNNSPVKGLYLHKLEDKTEFINKDGKVITSIPSSINFVYSQQTGYHSDKYFYTKGIEERDYYYLDQDKQVVSQLPYSQIEYLCPSILLAREKGKEGFQLLSAEDNRLLSDKTFTRYIVQRYTGVGILLYNDEGSFLLYDQNDKLVTENSKTVTEITLKKASSY
ncbi:hypothetical protein AAG747_04755 [Rapidithrix thailandica]|uniref:Uncharacterized protein n=1 Tax=Rapidithrix thailandica TaxID=413964 RepID=A0AAW9S659_9BACT